MEPQEVAVETPRGRICGLAWGEPHAPPVLCVHGWLDNAASFSDLAPRLPGYRIVAVDMIGHGLSDHLAAGDDYLFVDYVAVVHAILKGLGWDRVTLIGHSMGAGINSLVAGTFPDRVDKLVLLEGIGPLSEDPKHAPERLAKAIRDEDAKRDRRPPVYPNADAVATILTKHMSGLKPDSAVALLGRGLRSEGDGVTWRSDGRLRLPSRQRFTEEQVIAFLQRIACPTLLVRASAGWPFHADLVERRIDAITNLQLAEVAGGHHVHLDDAPAVAEIVAAFLSRTS